MLIKVYFSLLGVPLQGACYVENSMKFYIYSSNLKQAYVLHATNGREYTIIEHAISGVQSFGWMTDLS